MFKSYVFQTYLLKYFFTPIWGGIFLFSVLISSNQDGPSFQILINAIIPMLIWSAIWLITLAIQLRPVIANEESFIIKRLFKKDLVIEYKNIEWVYDLALLKGYIGLKYKDTKTLKSTRILIITKPKDMFNFNLTKEAEMVSFIREQIQNENPHYISENEPSRWKPFLLMIFTGFPLQFINFYYFFPQYF